MDSYWLMVLYFPVGFVCGVIAGFLSRDNGRGFAFGFVTGALLLIVGIAISAVTPREPQGAEQG